jgi:putative NADH-flavin reductase
MNILIFGASGATGHQLVSQATAQGHFVTAFVRSALNFRIKHKSLKVFPGDISDYQRVEAAIKNQDAVISALGASNPFQHNTTLIKGVQSIIKAMTNLNVKRFIYESYMGVHENRQELGFFTDKIASFLLQGSIADHEVKEEHITYSTLDWTIVRPAKLTNGRLTGQYRVGERITPNSIFPTISRADVADFMLKQLADKTYLHKKPRIMY